MYAIRSYYALGIDAGRAAFLAMRKVVERFDQSGVTERVVSGLWERATKSAGSYNFV